MKLEGFIGPTYTLEAEAAGAQRLVNLYLEGYEAGPVKNNLARFRGTPGLRRRATLGDGPIRGIHRASTGQLFVVSGANVYEVFSYWSAQLRSGGLASSSGRVTMASDGTRLVIGDGGATAFQVPLAAGSAVAAIGGDCPGGHVTWMDGYFIHTVPNTARIVISGLNALTYDALDTATAEGQPDNLVMPLAVGRQLFLVGEQTTEMWFNSGAADFPFQPNLAAFISTGTIAAGTAIRAHNGLVWVGNDENGQGTVWHTQGGAPQRISTHAVEFALDGYERLDEASAFAYQQGGHEFYQLSVPGGGTWVFDFTTGQWHERMYLSDTGEEPHRAWVGAVAFGEVVVGDREDGRLYTYDLEYFSDDGDEIRRFRQTGNTSQEEKRIRYNWFEIQAEMGVGLETGQGEEPTVLLSWSDDNRHTWSNEKEKTLGQIGEYKNRARWTRLGAARNRVWRIAVSDPVPVTLLGADIGAVQLGS